MSMQVLMGLVIALGVGAAAFLVMHGYEEVPTEAVQEAETNSDSETESEEPEDNEKTSIDDLEKKGPSNDEMFDNIEAGIDVFPEDRLRVYKYGAALVGLGEFDRAEKLYLKQLKLFPRDVQIMFGLGWCYEQNKRWADAINAYERATRLDFNHRASRNNLAWLLATAPDKSVRNGSKAVAIARQAIGKQQPPDPALMDTLAAAYAEVGSFKNAVRIQRYVSKKTKEMNDGVEKRLQLYLKGKPYRMPK